MGELTDKAKGLANAKKVLAEFRAEIAKQK